jgi:capsular polysaccharide biosynthesis protein
MFKGSVGSHYQRTKQQAKAYLSHMLQKMPVSSERIGPPKGVFENSVDWIAQFNRKNNHQRPVMEEIYQKVRRHRTPPKTLGNKTPWQFDAYYGGMHYEDQGGFIVEVPQGRVYGEGAVIGADDRLLGDISREMILGGDQSKHSIFKNWKLPPVQKIDQHIAVVAVQAAANYWHWMFDLLPRFHLLSKSSSGPDNIDSIVINKLNLHFQKQYLEALDIDFSRLMECEKDNFHIKAQKLIVPSITRGAAPKWACDFLHNDIGRKIITDKKEKKIKLYISRGDAKLRRIINEKDIQETLQKYGFECVQLSQLSVSQQADLFASAEIIVSPHGANLSNLVFCNEGTKVIELFSPRYVNSCFWVISNHLDLEYFCLIGEGFAPPEPPEGEDPKQWFNLFNKKDEVFGKDIFIDCTKLDAMIKLAGY